LVKLCAGGSVVFRAYSKGLFCGVAAGAFAVLALASPALAQTLTPTGHLDPSASSTIGNSVSADGSTIVGTEVSALGTYGFTFGPFGFTMLNPINPVDRSFGLGVATSGNNAIAVGFNSYFGSPGEQAVYWNIASGVASAPVDMGSIGLGATVLQSRARAISADGTTIVGFSNEVGGSGPYMNATTAFADYGFGMQGLGYLDPLQLVPYSDAYGVSEDGTYIVGESLNSDNKVQAFVSVLGGPPIPLGSVALGGDLGTDTSSIARAVTAFGGNYMAAGSVVHGNGVTEATSWDNGVPAGLGFLSPLVNPFSEAFAVSSLDPAYNAALNPITVVGDSRNDAGNTKAFVWTAATQMISVEQWLGPTIDLTGIDIQHASGVSGDGLTITGTMVRNGINEAYFAREGGLITPVEVVASLAGTAPVAAATATQNLARQGASSDCYAFDKRGICAFANFTAAFGEGQGTSNPDLIGLAGFAVGRAKGLRVGIAGGYALDRNATPDGGSYKAQAPVADVFIGYNDPLNTGIQFRANASYGYYSADIARGYANGAGTAVSNGTTNFHGFAGNAHLGLAGQLGRYLLVESFIGADARYATQDAYAETDGPFAAEFASRQDSTVIAKAGGTVTLLAGRYGSGISFTGNWAHRVLDDQDDIVANVTGVGPVTVTPEPRAKDWAQGEVKLTIAPSPSTRLHIAASAEAFGVDTSYAGNAGIQIGF
jgi:uncharacterized membrane protein